MEIHKSLNGIEKYRPDINSGSKEYFKKARLFVETFYSDEIKRISSVKFDEVTPELFFRECIWVVHATGFSAKAVGSFFPRLTEAYGTWEQASTRDFERTWNKVKLVCNNQPKAKGVCWIAKIIDSGIKTHGWKELKNKEFNTPELLQKLPFIGSVTCYHLARNIGLLDSIKPDLHLVRMAKYWGYDNCIEMCKDLKPENMELGIVDYILWMNASTFGTIEIKTEENR